MSFSTDRPPLSNAGRVSIQCGDKDLPGNRYLPTAEPGQEKAQKDPMMMNRATLAQASRLPLLASWLVVMGCNQNESAQSLCEGRIRGELLKPGTAEFLEWSKSSKSAYFSEYGRRIEEQYPLSGYADGDAVTMKFRNAALQNEQDSLKPETQFYSIRVRAEGSDGAKWAKVRQCRVDEDKCYCGPHTGKE